MAFAAGLAEVGNLQCSLRQGVASCIIMLTSSRCYHKESLPPL
jgi:hypothetical protein